MTFISNVLLIQEIKYIIQLVVWYIDLLHDGSILMPAVKRYFLLCCINIMTILPRIQHLTHYIYILSLTSNSTNNTLFSKFRKKRLLKACLFATSKGRLWVLVTTLYHLFYSFTFLLHHFLNLLYQFLQLIIFTLHKQSNQ